MSDKDSQSAEALEGCQLFVMVAAATASPEEPRRPKGSRAEVFGAPERSDSRVGTALRRLSRTRDRHTTAAEGINKSTRGDSRPKKGAQTSFRINHNVRNSIDTTAKKSVNHSITHPSIQSTSQPATTVHKQSLCLINKATMETINQPALLS